MNTTHPFRPDYTGPTAGWFTFLHHGQPVEYSPDVLERRDYVLAHKPAGEQEVRAWACQVIPPSIVPHALEAAGAARDTAWAARDTAWLETVLPETPWRRLYDEQHETLRYEVRP